MDATETHPPECRELHRYLRDIAALTALPAVWSQADQHQIGASLAEVLLRILVPYFLFVRLPGRRGEEAVEVFRVGQGPDLPDLEWALRAALEPWTDCDSSSATVFALPQPLSDGLLQAAVTPIGAGCEFGVLVVGSGQADFPSEEDRLLLGVAANQAAIVLQRNQAEEALHKQTEWLRVTLASIGDAVLTTDLRGRVTSLNPIAESLTGWTQQQALGQPLSAVFHIVDEETRQPVESPAMRALRQCQIVGLANHTILIARDGTVRSIDDSAAPIRDEQGNIMGVVLVFRDVTEARREMEFRLRLSAIVESSDDAIISKNLDGIIVSWNKGAERLYGWTAEEIVGQPLSLLVPPEHPDELPRIMERLRRGERIEHYETVRQCKDGTRLDVSLTISPVRGPDGKIIGASKIARDITSRKHVEQTVRFLAGTSAFLAEFKDCESTLQQVAALAVPAFADWCAVDLLQPDGSVRRLAARHRDPAKEPLAQDLFGRYPPHLFPGHGPLKVLGTGKSDWAAAIPDSVLVEAAGGDEEYLQWMRSLRLRSWIFVPLHSRNKTLGVLGFVKADTGRPYNADDLRAAEDLADRASIAIENANLLAALQEAGRRKDEFLAMLAHELRNPLAPIRNAIQILRAKGPPIPALQWARDIIERQLQQLTRLVDDLLDVSRITRGKVELRKERMPLAKVVSTAVESSRPLIDKWDHELTVTLPHEPIYLEADPTRLAQVLLNLLNNAAKYTEQGGHIWLTGEQQGNQVLIRVKDTGIGIPPEMLPHIFEMFAQVDSSLERAQGGLGIGLTLVQRLVEMHGGTVEAFSSGPGMGSEFVVRLPVAGEVASPGVARTAEGETPPGSARCRILVVDDNQDAADSLAMLLRLVGHEVHTAHDGLEAVGAAAVFRPGVVLMDIGLPKLDGYEAGRRIREQQGQEVVLIALTGWGQEEDRRRSKEMGFDHHMTKPVEFEALQKLLAELPKS